MKKTIAISVLVFAAALAGCSLNPFGGGDSADAPKAAPTPAAAAPSTGATPVAYEIKDADRGMVRRVRVLLNGRTVDTLTMSKGRTDSSMHCCTADGCSEIKAEQACSTFKMTCTADGSCSEVLSSPRKTL